MSARNGSGDDESPKKVPYEVGYGKPPRQHRFQPGHKGFGKRGSRKRKSPAEEIEAVMSEMITLNVGGKQVSMPAFRAMLLQQRNRALKGDPRAFGLVVNFLRASGSEAPERAVSDLLAEDARLLAEFKRRSGESIDDGGE